MKQSGEVATLEAVAIVREGPDGLYLDYVLEGGINALECAGTVLYAASYDIMQGGHSCDVQVLSIEVAD